jgi:predicted small secreted protein
MKIVVALTLVVGSLALGACNTVRGAAADLNSAATCTEKTMSGVRC